jgi:DNA-binding response OmpR family regulator
MIPQDEGGPGHAMKVVMLVEDDDETREALATILEEARYRVLRAANGAAAWSLLNDHGGACDIILLDLMMPVMNGWDFRRKQRESSDFSSIPVLLMSAGGNIASSCADLGTSDYIAKPVEVAELLSKIQRYCS